MPPCSLHHFVNASAVSNSSWLRPRRPEKPGIRERRHLQRVRGDARIGAGRVLLVVAGGRSRRHRDLRTRPGRGPGCPRPIRRGRPGARRRTWRWSPAVVSLSRPHAAATRSAANVRMRQAFRHGRTSSRSLVRNPEPTARPGLSRARARSESGNDRPCATPGTRVPSSGRPRASRHRRARPRRPGRGSGRRHPTRTRPARSTRR